MVKATLVGVLAMLTMACSSAPATMGTPDAADAAPAPTATWTPAPWVACECPDSGIGICLYEPERDAYGPCAAPAQAPGVAPASDDDAGDAGAATDARGDR